ncbi:MCP four helix bundle domain-containing protein, partial [Enterococcus sp.]|uniref:MCP four helix bundle domain-containing protein n=1 Tax=Enterococcus sp. TaxID=35783 RepID=UPI001B4DC6BC
PLTQQQKTEAEAVKTIVTQYRESNADVIALASQNKNEEAYKLFEAKSAPLGDQIFDLLIKISNEANQDAEQMTQIAKDDVTSSSMLSIVITIFALLIGWAVGILIIKQITMRLSDSVKFLDLLVKVKPEMKKNDKFSSSKNG